MCMSAHHMPIQAAVYGAMQNVWGVWSDTTHQDATCTIQRATETVLAEGFGVSYASIVVYRQA